MRDRKKDIIISGGENISTIEVENTIYRHPDVQEVSVIAIPDEKWGEVPKAFVVPKPGTQPSEADIIQFCRDHMAHFKCPKAVEFGRPAEDLDRQGEKSSRCGKKSGRGLKAASIKPDRRAASLPLRFGRSLPWTFCRFRRCRN